MGILRGVPPKPLLPETPSWLKDRSGSTGEGPLLQERLRLLGSIAGSIAVAFYVVQHVMAWRGLEKPLPLAEHGNLLSIVAITLGSWLYCRGRPRPERWLRTLDVLILLSLAGIVVLFPPRSIPEPELRGMVMLLEVTLILYARSIFVPSSARLTLLVSAAAALPLAVYALSTETLRLGIWKVMWLLAAVTISTAGSGVIYGLRREVRHARRLGQYTLEEKLGEGGMGEVYRARHALLRRPTAVKLLKPDHVGESSLRRFEREVQLTASLSHPNTVSVYDFGRTPEGVFYYAMEYLEGLSLEQLVRDDGPQPPGRVVHVLRQVLGALAEAHGIGLVHRDVKPGNVILCERGGLPDVAKVVDFGLVKDLDTADGLTHDGMLLGTPLYLAPEAIRSPETDPRSDIYSLGAVAYYLLTAQHVFEGHSVIEICGHHLHTKPVPPSERLGRSLPDDLERWVLGCLEKDADARPRTAIRAAQALDRCSGVDDWGAEAARAWWAGRGRALAAVRGRVTEPSVTTLSAPSGRGSLTP
jgi:hypothetical protein